MRTWRISLCLLFLACTVNCFSQQNPDTIKNKLESSLSFSLNSNGIAPIPAFSLDKPAIIASAGISKGRFSFDPGMAYSLEGKPWYIDTWLHYKIIARPKFELKAGVNFSSFCSMVSINDTTLLQAERYFTFSITGTYKITPWSSISVDYWSDNGQEKTSLKGHFFDIVYDNSGIRLGKDALLAVNIMLFYINYNRDNRGLFIGPRLGLSLRNIPVSLFCQGSQPLLTDTSPRPRFRWNVGISYTL